MADIGIMGGTFDPIHNGHLLLGKQAYLEYGLDQVWFMPSASPPHKTDHQVTDAAARCEMVRLAIAGFPYFRLSDFEITHLEGAHTYTARTLTLLRRTWPEHRFFFIIGADSLYEIESWYHPQEVMGQAVILAAGRSYSGEHKPLEQHIQYLKERYGADIRLLHCPEMDVSSGELREMERRGKQILRYVPKPVEEYILTHGLYQDAQ